VLQYQHDISRPTTGRTITGGPALESSEIARLAVDAATDKKAVNVVLLNVRDLTVIADYFVICTGTNPRQIAAIADAVDEELGKAGVQVYHREGSANTGWVLYDFGDVILHVFGPMEREYYQLENLWSAAPRLLYVE
jgi:ribosome-associated protein